MLLVVVRDDGTEESYDVAPNTKLRSCFKDNYWWFQIVPGGQVSLHVDTVSEVRLGNVQFADGDGKLDARAREDGDDG